jgi:anti-sigma regulatory factor (Ser/Thr protein kinase)
MNMNPAAANVVPFPVTPPKKVLLVGDGEGLTDFFASNMLSREIVLDSCLLHQRALQLVKRQKYDLVISCDRTPVWDDLLLLQKLFELGHEEMKMIIVVAATTPVEIIEAMRSHVFSIFSVPFDAAVLADMIERAIEVPLWIDGIELVSAKPEWIALKVRCSRVSAERLVQFGHELHIDLPHTERDSIMQSFRELLLNSMEHGARFNPNLKVDVGYLRTERLTLYYLRDPGNGFRLEETDHAAINNPIGDDLRHIGIRIEKGLRAGGFGIRLANELMDDLVFNEMGNEVVITKYR